MKQALSIGRVVHFLLGIVAVSASTSPETPNAKASTPDDPPEKVPVYRPAMIVAVNEDGSCNLQVFTDGANDDTLLEHRERSTPPDESGAFAHRVIWRTGIFEDASGERAGTYRWPPFVAPSKDAGGGASTYDPTGKAASGATGPTIAKSSAPVASGATGPAV